MYRYDQFDEQLVRERVAQFRGQVQRRLDGSLSEEEFKLIRQMNGVYLQLHAYMLRVAIPYGTMSAQQLRQLALIAEKYDRGYGHFTTRQNIQYNWPRLRDLPDIYALLAEVQMHGIQTSGTCIRNISADHLAGVARDEIEDPRPTAELIRQWSTLHPEFSYLPRKFKFAVIGSATDRAATKVHDIGIRIVAHPETGEHGYQLLVGGGMGRTPMIGRIIREFLPKTELLAFVEAILRVYNLEGRRDNPFKARVKILVHELGFERFVERVEEEYGRLEKASINVDAEEMARIAAYFAPPDYEHLPEYSESFEDRIARDRAFAAFARTNLAEHRVPGYTALTISLKPIGKPTGDASAEQMRTIADLAERHSFGEIRVTHYQNLVLPYVKLDDVYDIWKVLVEAGLGDANVGLITDIISCPGLDYCKLATARSIPIAEAISARFADPERQQLIGSLGIKISGCINACGHHHVGNIGILGLEKGGVENYQVTIGGDATENASLGERLGPGIDGDSVPEAIERLVDVYLGARTSAEESFIEVVRRIGLDPFKAAFAEIVEGPSRAAA
jgi:sulfite reductase (NADPH) hemoprotein beta-component